MNYKYIKSKYSFGEILYYSNFFNELDKYLEYLNDLKFDSKFTITRELKEEFYNDLLDFISVLLIENDVDSVLLKFDFLSKKFSFSCFINNILLSVYLEEKKYLINLFPNFKSYEIEKIKNFVSKSILESQKIFFDNYKITSESNILIVEELKKCLGFEKHKLVGFFDLYLVKLQKKSFKPFERFETDNDNLIFSDNVLVKDYIEPIKLSISDKVLLFESLMKIQNYESISQRKKASILSILFNESEETIRTYLRMIDKPSSESNNLFLDSLKKIENILRIYKIK